MEKFIYYYNQLLIIASRAAIKITIVRQLTASIAA